MPFATHLFRHADADLDEMQAMLEAGLGDKITSISRTQDELVLETIPEYLLPVLKYCRDNQALKCKQLVDIAGVDYPDRPKRFSVVYILLSHHHNRRLRVSVAADEQTIVPSCIGLFPAANWYEREVWDLYGVTFGDHPDLRRILTDYGFEGHPLRKDFPLTGYVEVRYDPERKQVVYEPVQLTQDYRRFDTLSPWEGMNTALPGDEKATEPAKN